MPSRFLLLSLLVLSFISTSAVAGSDSSGNTKSEYPQCRTPISAEDCATCKGARKNPALEKLSPLNEELKKTTLIANLKKQMRTLLEQQQVQTRKLLVCLGEGAGGKSISTADQKAMAPYCDITKNQLRKKIQASYSPMKIALSLTSPDSFKGIVLAEDPLQNKISLKPQHPFSDGSSIDPLSTQEQKAAGIIWDASFYQAQEKYEEEQKKNMPVLPKTARNVPQRNLEAEFRAKESVQFLRNFQEQEKQTYSLNLQKAPIMLYLKNDHPTDDELRAAAEKMQAHQAQALKDMGALDKADPDSQQSLEMMSYQGLVEQFLTVHPDYCSAADSLTTKLHIKNGLHIAGHLALAIGAGVPCVMFAGPVGLGCVAAANTAIGGYETYSAMQDSARMKALAFSNITSDSSSTSLASPAQAENAQNSVKQSMAMTAAAPLMEAPFIAASKAERVAAQEASQFEKATSELDSAGVQYRVDNSSGQAVIEIQGSGDKQWLNQLAAKFKKNYNTDVQIMPPGQAGPVASVSHDPSRGTFTLKLRSETVQDPDIAKPTIVHEAVHLKNSKALAKGDNTGLSIEVSSSAIEEEYGLPVKNYQQYFRMDEVEAYYKGARAAESQAKKYATSDPKLAQVFIQDSKDQRAYAAELSAASRTFLKHAEDAIRDNPSSVSNPAGSGPGTFVVTMPGKGSNAQTITMTFQVKNFLMSNAEVRKDLLRQIEKAEKDLDYYDGRLQATASQN